jgi:hypothetical protein
MTYEMTHETLDFIELRIARMMYWDACKDYRYGKVEFAVKQRRGEVWKYYRDKLLRNMKWKTLP